MNREARIRWGDSDGPANESGELLDAEHRPAVPAVSGFGSDDYELFEEDGEFVLTVEMPGFETDEIDG